MKRTYLARRNALLSSPSISWGTGALLFAVLVFILRLLVPNLFLEVTAPFLHASNSLASETHVFLAEFSDRAALTARNEALTAQNEALATENAVLTAKLISGGNASSPVAGITAEVSAHPPVSPYDTLILGEGEGSGVTLHMEAFAPTGTPIGVVSSVLPSFSQVTLFSMPGVETHGWVGQGSLPVTLTGAGGGVLTASVPRAAHIAVGDRVFVPGPGQLPVGTVARIDSDELSPSITLRIALSVNLFSLSSVTLRSTGITGMAFATSTLP